MPATIIDGNAIAASARREIKERVDKLAQEGRSVHLTAVIVGATPAAELYAGRQRDACAQVGIQYELVTLPANIPAAELLAEIHRLNRHPSVTGIMLHMPLPKHLNAAQFQNAIDPVKDVEGVGAASLGYILAGQPVLIPCTALAAFELAKSTGVPLRGADAVVIGASAIAGKPAALLLSDERATVSICRSGTANLTEYTRRAKILVVAVGKPRMIGADHVAPGAVVIDVGINRITLADGTKKTVGDVDFEAVKDIAGFITPVPGGVGPMTVAMLLKNTLRSAELVYG